jgi:hypothetical protein
MARARASFLSGTRVEEGLKEEFLKAVEINHEKPSEALRALLAEYVERTKAAELRRQSAIIREDGEEEAEAMHWISVHSLMLNDDD